MAAGPRLMKRILAVRCWLAYSGQASPGTRKPRFPPCRGSGTLPQRTEFADSTRSRPPTCRAPMRSTKFTRPLRIQVPRPSVPSAPQSGRGHAGSFARWADVHLPHQAGRAVPRRPVFPGRQRPRGHCGRFHLLVKRVADVKTRSNCFWIFEAGLPASTSSTRNPSTGSWTTTKTRSRD